MGIRTVRRIMAALILALAGMGAPLALLLACSGPAGAQFFEDRFPFDRFFRPPPQNYRQDVPRAPPPDNSKAPPAKKADTEPLTSVVVVGDSMADWLAYGLENAFVDTPEMGVVRKDRTLSGLIRNDPTRTDVTDWPQAIKEILNTEKADVIVMMIGLHDRHEIRERAPATPARGTAAGKPPAQPGAQQAPQAATQDPPAADDPADGPESPSTVTAEQPRPGSTIGTYEYRSEKWVELYSKRIDETIAALKSKGIPVFWVGLPSIRGTRSTSDASFLDDLYRSRADKNGIVYVDVWDGFADENGRFVPQGPDFEGQIRKLRSADGVHFTQAGAIKLAHYVEREIQRVMTARNTPIAIPIQPEPAQQAPAARPGAPTARPLSGPVMPLTAAIGSTEDLVGGGAVTQNPTDAVATRVLIKGEPVPAPAGRADDFAWPRRGVAPVGSDPVAATTTLPMTPMVALPPKPPAGTVTAAAEPPPAAARPPGAARAALPRAPRPPSGFTQNDTRYARPPQQSQSPFFLLFPPIR